MRSGLRVDGGDELRRRLAEPLALLTASVDHRLKEAQSSEQKT